MLNRHLYKSARSADEFPRDAVKEAMPFAHDFELIANLLDQAGSDGEVFALYLSTCRNAYLTLNAMFYDIREAFGTVSPQAGVFGALQDARSGALFSMEECLLQSNVALSSLQDKATCWKRRVELQDLLGRLTDQLSFTDRETLRTILEEVQDHDNRCETQNFGPFLSFSSNETHQHRLLLQLLSKSARKLEEATGCIRHVHAVLTALPNESSKSAGQQFLFNDATSTHLQMACETLQSLLSRCRESEDFEIIAEAVAHIERKLGSGADALHRGTSMEEKVTFLKNLACHMQEAVTRLYSVVTAEFKPNEGNRRMPPVFLVDLSVPNPEHPDIHRVATLKSFSHPQLENLTIAVARPPFSSKAISSEKIQYSEDRFRGIAAQWATLAIIAAAESAKLVIFPELFLPSDQLEVIHDVARKHGIGLVGGVEGVNIDGKHANFATILLPEDRTGGHRQFKAHPSNHEPDSFYSKGGQCCFLRSSIGSFSVFLCNDYREFDIVSAVEQAPFLDYLVVCCCNPYQKHWAYMAVSDAIRLQTYVILANWSEEPSKLGFGQGSICTKPSRDFRNLRSKPRSLEVVYDHAGTSWKGSLLFHDLHVSALYRDRKKPHDGLLAPPLRRLNVNK